MESLKDSGFPLQLGRIVRSLVVFSAAALHSDGVCHNFLGGEAAAFASLPYLTDPRRIGPETCNGAIAMD
eukprot:6485476-Amphidinium_carterae.1